MNIDSPMGMLVKKLEEIKLVAHKYRAKLTQSEATTRAVLIDPVIRTLGWDLSNPEMVEFERSYQGTKLDYALNDGQGEVRFIVEAKALGVNLSNDSIFTKILSYAITYRIPNIYLTDGIIWKHYKLKEFDKLEPVVFDISKDSLLTIAQYLVWNLDASLYWYGEVLSPDKKENETNKAPVEQTVTITPEPNQVISEQTGSIIKYVSLTALKEDLSGKPHPDYFRLPDGTIKTIGNWRDILVESVFYVLAKNKNLNLPIKDKAGKRAILVDFNKMNLKGAIVKGKYLERDVYIYTNYDTNHVISNSLHILGKLPMNEGVEIAAIGYKP